MRKVKLWKNRRAIKLYASLAIVLLTLFQCYWLYSVYQSEKSIIIKESENILKNAVLETEIERTQKQLNNEAFTSLSDSNEDIRKLAQILKSLKNAKIEVTYEGGQDSISDKILDKMAAESIKDNENKAKTVFMYSKLAMKSTFIDLNYSIYHFDKDAVTQYPRKIDGADGKTEPIISERDAKQFYEIHFSNLDSLVFKKMTLSIILSIIYIVIYISAIILLIVNINKGRKLMQHKDNFTNNMTHEFKTPMATISAAIEALNKYDILDDKEMTKEYLNLMKGDLDRLINMTDAILYNAKMSDGTIMLQFHETDLYGFINAVVGNLKPVLEKKNAAITVIPSPELLLVNADSEHFGNVFRNLIDNSIKYSEENAEISIILSKQGHFARILFSDKGIGIPDKYKNEIFKSYFRVMEKDMYTVKGYGLGLSYVKEIIDLHKGKIQAVPKTEKGTTFEILIPLTNE